MRVGCNPVKYIDPDGKYVINKTDQIIAIKPEHSSFYILLAPGAKYNGQAQLPDGSSSIIDKGKVDGTIDGTGKIFKVSDSLKSLLTVDIKVTKDKDGNIKMDYANFKSFLVSKLGDLIKKTQKRDDMSGHYNMTDKEKPSSSWSSDYNNTLGDSSKWKEKMNGKDIVLIPIPKDEGVDK